tara:strand:- start:450 stop:740 length:291 start_codon:yes stop_codon:yes gene_type:complete
MSEYINYSACDLSQLIEDTYGKELNIPYEIMEDQKLYEVHGVCVMENSDDQDWVDDQIHEWKNGGCANSEQLEAIMSDLCAKGLLKEGDYLLEFDD